MPWVGFEPTIPASERAKTVHVLDRSVTITGKDNISIYESRGRSKETRLSSYLHFVGTFVF
jgi:hypothetical protein